MIKTFTPTNLRNFNEANSTDYEDTCNEKFYSAIKLKLDNLKRDPADEVINKILNYSKKR